MSNMGKKSRRQKNKEVKSSSNRNTLVVGVILITVVGYWGINQLGGSGYPKLVSGVFYDAATVSADGKVSVPQDVLDNGKLVFVDVKLENATDEFNYLGRRITLSGYRAGEYLPLRAMQQLQLPHNRRQIPAMRCLRNPLGHRDTAGNQWGMHKLSPSKADDGSPQRGNHGDLTNRSKPSLGSPFL